MVIKSLTITENAYTALSMFKRVGESFSEVILRITHDKTSAMDKYFGILKRSDTDAKSWIGEVKKARANDSEEWSVRQKKLLSIR